MIAKKKSAIPNLPEGFFDIVPEEQKWWYYIWRRANGLLSDYSFMRLDLAPAEQAETFTRPVATSDPERSKDLAIARSHGHHLALRADIPASLMRVYLQHAMQSEPHPVKMFASVPVVSAHRGPSMQWQLGVETIGDDSEAVDAELLFLACRILESLNIGTFAVRLNTVGDALGRTSYVRALKDFYRQHAKKISARVHAAAKEHPFRGLRLLAIEDPDLAKDVPQSVDYLSEQARLYFKRLLEFLDEGQVPYLIDPTLLTDDDYASNTVWECVLDATAVPTKDNGDGTTGTPLDVAAVPAIRGGRMDRLAELMGGPKTPASGWTMDLGAIVTRLKAKNPTIPEAGTRPKVFLSQLGDAAKKRSLLLFEEIRKSGIEVRYSLSRDTIKGQLRMAAKLGVRFALIFGQKEALEGTVIVREMDTGIQETIPQEKIIDELKKRLKTK